MFHVHFVQRKKSVPGNENELWMTLWIRLWSSCSRLNFCPKVKPALGSSHHDSNLLLPLSLSASPSLSLSVSLSLSLSLAQMVKLQACIKYCEEDYSAAKVTSSLTFTDNTYK